MTDLERRLSAVLHAATEPPPPGLLEAVVRRHRRRRIRLGASLVAVVAATALALPPLASALSGGSHGGAASPALLSGGQSSTRPVAATGTVLRGCADGPNAGAIGRDWQAGPATEAGPLWFIDGGHSSGPVRLYVAVAVLDGLRPGSVVVVRVAPGWGRELRFLYGPRDSLQPGVKHLMSDGETGVTFAACPPGQQIVRSRQVTDYYGGFLVRGARCVPVRVWVPGRARPLTAYLGACPGR